MSTKPIDSVFDVPERGSYEHPVAPMDPYPGITMSAPPNSPDDPHQQDGDHRADVAGTPGADVEWTNAELHSIASTIEELQRRLEIANTRLSSVATVETTEVEIGRLFV